jgi:hypothetical protein
VANFNGQTFFELFRDDSTYIELLEEQLRRTNLEQQQDESGAKSDNILLRRLYYTLLLPTSVQGNNAYSLLGEYDPPLIHEAQHVKLSEIHPKPISKLTGFLEAMSPLKLFKKDEKQL